MRDLVKLISFDIDGTLEIGDPPGLVTFDMVLRAREQACLVGSCSDRTINMQQRVWDRWGIAADFMVLKHQLGDVKARFQAEEYYHVGDTDLDRFSAQRAGFKFVSADTAFQEPWGAPASV